MDKTWQLKHPDSDLVKEITNQVGCSELLAKLLVNRDITEPEHARRFLNPSRNELHDPNLLRDVGPAIERIITAIENDESILIFADRDVDGITGCTVLHHCFELLEHSVNLTVPRKWDGYGLSEEKVQEAVDREVELIITVDCGSRAEEPIQQAREHDIDVVVTDHHETGDNLPKANAVINPKRSDSNYPNRDLSGGAVAYKLAKALIQGAKPSKLDAFENTALPLVAISTLGDYMNLTLENRALVRLGFERFEDCQLQGLTRLCEHKGVDAINDLSWSLIPLLNAGQEDESGELMLEAILAKDPDRIEEVIEQLESHRTKRKQRRREQKAHLEECFQKQVEPEQLIYLIETDEYVGGVPRVQLSTRTGRPVITYRQTGDGMVKGGGRSDSEVDFIELYRDCAEVLEDYWGHPGAAGFKLLQGNLDQFKDHLRQAVKERYTAEQLKPKLEVDQEISLDQWDEDFLENIDRLRPFGHGNPEPLFCFKKVKVSSFERFGEQDQHFKFIPSASNVKELVYWNGAKQIENDHDIKYCDVTGTLRENSYNDELTIDVKDYRKCEAIKNE